MRRILPIIVLALLLTLAAVLITMEPREKKPAPQEVARMTVHFLDIGQGDCILVQTPDHRNVLVDAGDKESAERIVSYLERRNADHIDLLMITHPHADHIGGLPIILRRFGIARVLDAGYPHGSETYAEALSIIQERNIEYGLAGEQSGLHVSRDVCFELLWPPADYTPAGDSGLNNGSVVVRATYKSVSFLLAGDIQEDTEGRLLGAQKEMRSTVLKVAHHGSRDGTSNEFLQVVKPDYAVISVGTGNPYGHPDPATLTKLHAAGAQVIRTDEHGMVVFSTDGTTVQVKMER